MKDYYIERIMITQWNEFMNKCIRTMSEYLNDKNIQYYKLHQKILYFNTYVIGLCSMSEIVIFPKEQCIKEHQKILYDDFVYNWHITDEQFNKLIQIYKHYIYKYKSIIKKQIRGYNTKKVNIAKEEQRDRIILKIEKETYVLSKDEYERLKKMYNKDEKIDEYICMLLLRYQYYGQVKEGINLSAKTVYQFIKDNGYINKTLEAFAGALNSDLPNYCSLFYDIEKYFGSKGSFLQKEITCKYNFIISNPPYISSVIYNSSLRLLLYLKQCSDLMIIVIIPDWRSVDEYKDDQTFQISKKEVKHERQKKNYNGYNEIRNSEYFRYVICYGGFKFHNYFRNVDKNIDENILFVVLSTEGDNKNLELFKKYMDK